MKPHVLVCSFVFCVAGQLAAQSIGGHRGGAEFAASRADLQVGSSFSYLYPDYGPGHGYQINPYAAIDFRRSYIGVELDGNLTVQDKAASHPNSFIFGLRVGADVGKARVFVRPGIGIGHFSGVTTTASSNSQIYRVYELAGGVDYQLLEHTNVRLSGGYQIWPNFDGNTTAEFDHGGHLNPIYAGIGVAYRF